MFKKFFKDVSPVPIIAGALAAVTSFLLSARIGLAGSVIGVALGSIVSAIASQVYQNVLRESGKKLQENLDFLPTSLGDGDDGDQTRTQIQQQTPDNTIVEDHSNAESGTETAVISPVPVSESRRGRVVESGTTIHLDAAARHSGVLHFDQQSKHTKRKIILVSVISALLAVGISAGIILAVTGGQGTDDVVRTIVVPRDSQEQTDQPNQAGANSTQSTHDSTGNQQTQNKTTDKATAGTESQTGTSGNTSDSTGSSSSGTTGTSGSTSSTESGASSGSTSDSTNTSESSGTTSGSTSESNSSGMTSGNSSGSSSTSGSTQSNTGTQSGSTGNSTTQKSDSGTTSSSTK